MRYKLTELELAFPDSPNELDPCNRWVTHYNGGRPHSALGPGVPDPPENQELIPKLETRHCLAADALVLVKSILGGLHHEYSLAAVPDSA